MSTLHSTKQMVTLHTRLDGVDKAVKRGAVQPGADLVKEQGCAATEEHLRQRDTLALAAAHAPTCGIAVQCGRKT